MEKPCNSSKKKTIFKLLPKAAAAAAFIFQNAPFSPARERKLATDYKTHLHHHKGFAGPIISIIPAESGRKSEPASPKISCIGQIKHNKKKMLKTSSSRNRRNNNSSKNQQKIVHVKKKSLSSFGNIFGGKSKLLPGRKSNASDDNVTISKIPDRAPCLSNMKRFASGREPLSNFDWRSMQIITPNQDYHKYYTDDDTGFSEDEDEEEEDDDDDEKEELDVSFSAAIVIGGCRKNMALEPRKEINLWKRRTMDQPKPLQLNSTLVT